MSNMIFMKYLPAARGKLTARLKFFRNSCLIFQVFRSQLRYLTKVSFNIYHKLCQNWFPILNYNLDYKI